MFATSAPEFSTSHSIDRGPIDAVRTRHGKFGFVTGDSTRPQRDYEQRASPTPHCRPTHTKRHIRELDVCFASDSPLPKYREIAKIEEAPSASIPLASPTRLTFAGKHTVPTKSRSNAGLLESTLSSAAPLPPPSSTPVRANHAPISVPTRDTDRGRESHRTTQSRLSRGGFR